METKQLQLLRFQLVSCGHLFALVIIIRLKLLCVVHLKAEKREKKTRKGNSSHHLLDVLLREPALVIGDGDLVLVTSALVAGRHIQHSVGVNLKSHLQEILLYARLTNYFRRD